MINVVENECSLYDIFNQKSKTDGEVSVGERWAWLTSETSQHSSVHSRVVKRTEIDLTMLFFLFSHYLPVPH